MQYSSFIPELLKYRSLSIVGLEKNTGKTECLNYILKRLPLHEMKVAVTSIGIDGETVDQVTRTAKPEIWIGEGVYFSTAHRFYASKGLYSELVDISDERSSLGEIVTAKALCSGKVLLAGPSSAPSLRRWMDRMDRFNVDLKIIDGALSRLSLASPAVSQAMVLATGAAYSINMQTLVNRTKFIVDLINLDLAENEIVSRLLPVDNGLWGIDEDGVLECINSVSSINISENYLARLEKSRVIYVAGALTERLLKIIKDSKGISGKTLIVRDFTKFFVNEQTFALLLRKSVDVRVLQKSKLIAVCANPVSPAGYVLDSDALCENLQAAIGLPVYDIVKNAD